MINSIQFFGYSGGVPTKLSGTTSAIISCNNFNILIDCAEGTFEKIIGSEYKLGSIRQIFITHLHPDHVSGLIPFLFYKHVIRNGSNITLYGPNTLEPFVRQNFEYLGFSPFYNIDFIIVSDAECIRLNPQLEVNILKVEHGLSCFAFRLSDRHKSLTYITDTRKFEKIIPFSENTDVLFLEATFPAGSERMAYSKYHLSIQDAFEIAEKSKAKRLYLMHSSPRIDKKQMISCVYHTYPCWVSGKKIDLRR